MKNAFWLVGLVLCASTVMAADLSPEVIAQGKKRNEDLYEKMLIQTGALQADRQSASSDKGQLTAEKIAGASLTLLTAKRF